MPVVQQPITDTLDGSATPGIEDASDPDQSITNTVSISETFTIWEPSPPMVRISIPAIKVNRAIVDIGWINKRGGQDWDTDSLFANQNRQDLVGHLEGSALPREGENIVLVGHNYDWGIYQWEGVFAKVKKLSQGDKIKVYTEGGEELIYYVEDVKVISFANNNKNLAKHARLIGLTNSERLTLVTCGGANIGLWNKRVYVIAVPANQYGEIDE
jgi:LPXTG-site transpeptidase (sortase) family protein